MYFVLFFCFIVVVLVIVFIVGIVGVDFQKLHIFCCVLHARLGADKVNREQSVTSD